MAGRRAEPPPPEVVGTSRALRTLVEQARALGPTPLPVLIQGETGTGKELIARVIHAASGRAPFLPVNVASMAGELVPSELFGHVAGAFTGATADKRGLFEAADGGFREDLLARLKACTISVPPLRERPADIEPLALHFLDGHPIRRGALDALRQYPWPRNVRELKNEMTRAQPLLRIGPGVAGREIGGAPMLGGAGLIREA